MLDGYDMVNVPILLAAMIPIIVTWEKRRKMKMGMKRCITIVTIQFSFTSLREKRMKFEKKNENKG